MADPASPKTSVGVRDQMVEALRLDLIGPHNAHPFAEELLPESPARWYLSGFLVPTNAPIEHRYDETSGEEIDSPGEPIDLNESAIPERTAAHRCLLPSSMGLSFLVGESIKTAECLAEWGDYVYESPDGDSEPEEAEGEASESEPSEAEEETQGNEEDTRKRPRGFRRKPQSERIAVNLPEPGSRPATIRVSDSGGLILVATVRPTKMESLPEGTKAVSIFLVNQRPAQEEARFAYRANAFQTQLTVHCAEGFVPRPDPRGTSNQDEWDERVSELQYRDAFEYAVGHGVSAAASLGEDGVCRSIHTTWIPEAEVERVEPASISGVELGMEALGALTDGADAKARLQALPAAYNEWIERQKAIISTLSEARGGTARDMLGDASLVAQRIEDGIQALQDPDVLEAFRIANRAVARAFRQRVVQGKDQKPEDADAPTWHPFQLAFLLMTLRGIVDPTHADREQVDLLFFPTGGGKTEAYFGLAAFALVLRRLRNPGIRSAGMTVLMRYTLRLLTLDQLGRAAALICALELERESNPRLGDWPFEIGLWVGQGATPNRMGHRGDTSKYQPYTAYTKTMRFKQDPYRNPAPIPLEECPWCGTKFDRNSFRLVPNVDRPLDLRVTCANHRCPFHGDRPLPIVAVDEPIYRRLPCFLIATVDKFAALPWTGETGTLFGKVQRYDEAGFYGPCDPNKGYPIPEGNLPPPELIIQDELHLISGPLGTVAGLYETAIDALCSCQKGEKTIRPKIVASTATVRRAEPQIRALFGRPRVSVFPAPGPDRRDSFFARTVPSSEVPARLYLGVAAQGRSLKVVLLRAALALLSAGQTAWELNPQDAGNPVDPYMSLLGYFGSLRELGGSRRIIEDEVRTRLAEYHRRRRREPEDATFTSRHINYEVVELTSRVTTDKVAEAKRQLALPFARDEHVDVALATNMISVGLDITRLGLMTVLGQPKTSSEYIQATSRVGRDREKPGLVVTLMNIHRPRDRSHYERFAAYHESFYRHVEATSVTPFSPRALDRALPGALVALCRQLETEMTPPAGAQEIIAMRSRLDAAVEVFGLRAQEHRSEISPEQRQALYSNLLHRSARLLDDWLRIANDAAEVGAAIQYQKEASTPNRRLLYGFLDPELASLDPIRHKFRANRSMRDIEPGVDVNIKDLNDWGDAR